MQLKFLILLKIVNVINRNKYVCVCGQMFYHDCQLQILFKYFTLLFQSCHSIIFSQGISMWIHSTLNYVSE